ncbi:MAG: sigma-70 family RNA polymerase sigma factor [Fimbriimonadaceae bacterium]|nr:sigma-70 family RNA polymerase sigma factor [Fimbriimonadaceae bacterium]QYK56160.1 MAG: sigma-70 family RNA polymerase sigma factor [Fimbriimonadaceae bacterium]
MVSREAFGYDDQLPSYLGRLTQTPLLTAAEEMTLTRAAQAGCSDSRKRIVEANMRLVVNIAKGYRHRSISLEDLVQEGAIGLLQAIDRFDPEKGFRFSTYATHWIKQAIARAITGKTSAIRLPAHVSQALRRVERERQIAVQQLGTEPSCEQLAERLGISSSRLRTLLQCSQDLVSLDIRVGENDSATLGSLISDDNAIDPEAEALNSEAIEEILHALSELTEREQKVMAHRLRIEEGGGDAGRDELCDELKLSRERIRQIEVSAVKKLRRLAQRRRTLGFGTD